MAIPLELISSGTSDTGMVREVNEDAFYENASQRLFIVADGMGGHQAGDVASGMVVEGIPPCFPTETMLPSEELDECILDSIAKVNGSIHEMAQNSPDKHGMGTTLVLLYALQNRVRVAHVGDSRAYLIRGERITQITDDHSWINQQVKAGVISKEEAEKSAHKNVILRAVGTRPTVEAELGTIDIAPMDRLLLCSDGLSNMLSPVEMWDIVTHASTLKGGARKLIEAANNAGGTDNITALLVQFVPRPRRLIDRLHWFFYRQVAR
jgi:PPM family protein phosphatase